jgi:hypothetical protein
VSTAHRPYLCDGDAAEQPLPATAALATLIPGGNPERMSVVVTETTPDGAHHAWSGSLAAFADRIAPTPAPALSDGERAYLLFALELAEDEMRARGTEFGDDDRATLATLRKLAGGGS